MQTFRGADARVTIAGMLISPVCDKLHLSAGECYGDEPRSSFCSALTVLKVTSSARQIRKEQWHLMMRHVLFAKNHILPDL